MSIVCEVAVLGIIYMHRTIPAMLVTGGAFAVLSTAVNAAQLSSTSCCNPDKRCLVGAHLEPADKRQLAELGQASATTASCLCCLNVLLQSAHAPCVGHEQTLVQNQLLLSTSIVQCVVVWVSKRHNTARSLCRRCRDVPIRNHDSRTEGRLLAYMRRDKTEQLR